VSLGAATPLSLSLARCNAKQENEKQISTHLWYLFYEENAQDGRTLQPKKQNNNRTITLTHHLVLVETPP
jgi:hypothetical protein